MIKSFALAVVAVAAIGFASTPALARPHGGHSRGQDGISISIGSGGYGSPYGNYGYRVGTRYGGGYGSYGPPYGNYSNYGFGVGAPYGGSYGSSGFPGNYGYSPYGYSVPRSYRADRHDRRERRAHRRAHRRSH